jgi:hypothetical protein
MVNAISGRKGGLKANDSGTIRDILLFEEWTLDVGQDISEVLVFGSGIWKLKTPMLLDATASFRGKWRVNDATTYQSLLQAAIAAGTEFEVHLIAADGTEAGVTAYKYALMGYLKNYRVTAAANGFVDVDISFEANGLVKAGTNLTQLYADMSSM